MVQAVSAIPVQSAAPQSAPSRPLLRVVPPAQLDAALKAQDDAKAQAAMPLSDEAATGLAGHIRTLFEQFKRHRNDSQAGWTERLLAALRTFNGQYDPAKLAEIKRFRGSESYARIISMKCRGTTSLLRDVYLSPDKAWGVKPPPDPEVPASIIMSIQQLLAAEIGTLKQGGQPVDPTMIRDRTLQLMEGARQAEKKQSAKRAVVAEDKIEELLRLGNFYKALAEFLVDLPLFPFSCIKGPTVRIIPSVKWTDSGATIEQTPRLFWNRISPFDMWFTPGVTDIEDASVIERGRITRSDLNDLLDLPGYNVKEIRAVLDEYGAGGLADDWDASDAERAVQERRENPRLNQSGLINYLEFHGNVQGRVLLEYGMDKKLIKDELRDYMVQGWLIGRHVIKCQLSPSPRKRHPYFITSFEKVPGTPVGNALPDILGDIQDNANATLRALINNLSIASGPQVVVFDDRVSPGEDAEDLYPWKRWHMTSDPVSGNSAQKPVDFFQPQSNAAELLSVYMAFNNQADDLAALPKYLQGQTTGGPGRTAAGLAMLMGNASKILATVAANIDRDVMEPALQGLFDMLMLTDTTGLLRGDESIQVLGVNVAVQRETERSRQLEFLQITANPIDTQIMGPKGRAVVLRSVSQSIGLDGEEIVPTEDEIDAAMKSAQPQPGAPQPGGPGSAEAGAQAQGSQKGPVSTKDTGPRENLTPRVAGGAG